jgi:hypothetical protein
MTQYTVTLCALQSVVDAVEQKSQFDVQLGKANADAVGMKAAFDKVMSDNSRL